MATEAASLLPPEFVQEMDLVDAWLENNMDDAGLVKWKDKFFALCAKYNQMYFMNIPCAQAAQLPNKVAKAHI